MTSEDSPRNLSRKDVTILLQAWNEGDPYAPQKLAPLIYAELRKLARRSMRRENPQHTLETGALINEAYLRLADWKNARWENRAHFYGVAAQIMRRVLVDHARAHNYQKRGGGARPLSLDEAGRRTCWLWTKPWSGSPNKIRARARSWNCGSLEVSVSKRPPQF